MKDDTLSQYHGFLKKNRIPLIRDENNVLFRSTSPITLNYILEVQVL